MKINFRLHFRKGAKSYDSRLSKWWMQKSADAAHEAAYKNVARVVHDFWMQHHSMPPRQVIDYACGNGAMIPPLLKAFPKSRLIGLDGSKRMLSLAKKRINEFDEKTRVKFIETALPDDMPMPGLHADLVFFVFPDMNFQTNQKPARSNEEKIARYFCRLREKEISTESVKDFLHERDVSNNIHKLLKTGGYWVKVEYADSRRADLEETNAHRLLFLESALCVEVDGQKIEPRFRLLADFYFDSPVISDLFDQTGNPDDLIGGYDIAIFQPLKF